MNKMFDLRIYQLSNYPKTCTNVVLSSAWLKSQDSLQTLKKYIGR